MPTRKIGSHDQETGEVLDGVAVWIGRKIVSPYGSQWMQVNQDALAEIAADKDLGLEAWRVFAYLNARLDFENLIVVQQTEIAAALGMKPQSVYRAMKLLAGKQIILRGPKLGGVGSYRLNPHYGWKGKVQNLHQARQERVRVIAEEAGPDVLGELDDAPLSDAMGRQGVFRPSDVDLGFCPCVTSHYGTERSSGERRGPDDCSSNGLGQSESPAQSYCHTEPPEMRVGSETTGLKVASGTRSVPGV